ncbi:MAG: hypothetical protein ACRDJ1_07530, partial [Actinomycetota bacterium]
MRFPPWLTSRPVRRAVLLVGFAFCAGRIFAPVSFPFSSGDLVVRVTPNVPGGTVALDLGPFGELTWDTHTAPLDVRASFVIGQRPRELPDL